MKKKKQAVAPVVVRAEKEPQIHCAHTKLVPIGELRPNPRNPNKHPPEQLRLLAKIICHAGWRAPVVVSKRSGLVVKGHGRLAAAKLAGLSVVPVDVQDYKSAADELADLVADNRIAELAEMSLPDLKDLLQELDTGEIDMEITGFAEEPLADLMSQFMVDLDVDAEPQIDKAEELRAKWGVELGQVWELGAHRIVCGDSTSAEVVGRLLGEDKPHLMVTDPPYGVEYDASWRNEADRANGKPYGARAIGKVMNDNRADWSDAWALFPGDVIYQWHPPGATSLVHAKALQDSGFVIRMQIIWAKNQFPIGRGDYHVKHEPCWYAVRDGKSARFTDDRTQTTLWEIDKPHKSETGHSTQKPVECMERPIRNNSKPGDLVYEPFSGSGTTIIACERTGRKCRAIELNPGYVAVAIQRWADATGGTPKKIHG